MRYYTQEHEWIEKQGEIYAVGVSEHAQKSLGEIVFVQLPQLFDSLEKGDMVVVLESVKAASEVYMPLSGMIQEINHRLIDEPELINQDPLGQGWCVKLQIDSPHLLKDLMSQKEYDKFLESL